MATALASVDPRPTSRWDVPEMDDTAEIVIGIRFRHGHPAAEVVAGVDGRALRQALQRHFPDLRPWEQALRPYVALVVRHRLRQVSREDPHPPHGHAELGAFWGYLRLQLTSRGGIRRDRLGLYLAEYSWRYRWRGEPIGRVVDKLEALISPSGQVSLVGLWGDAEKKRSAGEGSHLSDANPV